ncbi:MAG: glutamine--fructose-6-phosphate transaminase (isomerizing) [Patescibacteria group bacterium]
MCGIVGYVGGRQAQNILVGGLKRLEYRGYDSAGIATLNAKGKLTSLREKGKVAALAALQADNEVDDRIGIGHTRWATHGAPSVKNAHPHTIGRVTLVHNGIIENFQDLKQILGKKGYEFTSDTDTEVLTALVDSLYQGKTSLLDAVLDALRVVVGAYGIAVLSRDQPDRIIVARSGSPLIIGVADDETFIASDASALIGHTDKVIYLKEGEVAECRAGEVELYDVAANKLDPAVETLEADMQAIQKEGYDHFLLKEIHEQPDTLRATLAGRVNTAELTVRLGGINMTDAELRAVRNIIVVGCGTANYAGQLASYFIEQFTSDVSVRVEIASELRYRSFHVPDNSIALIVSQSGETADTLACLTELKRRGVRCLGIVNAVGSSIAREVDGGVYVHVGPEISVASTKAFTSQVAAMVLFGLVVAQAKGTGPKELGAFIRELDMLPTEIEAVIAAVEPEVKRLAQKYSHYEHALYIGRDTMYPIALEGALKLKEISYIQAEGHASGELKHGPIALVDDNFFEMAFITDNWLYEKSISNLIEVNARGGHVIAVTDSNKDVPAEEVVRIDTKLEVLSPLVFNIVSQLFAYYVSLERGNDVDQPRNLAKSVTVE